MHAKEDDRQWCYQFVSLEEDVHGPFPSCAEAMADAASAAREFPMRKPVEVDIGRVRWADPIDALKGFDFDLFVEDMEERMCDDEFGWCEDAIFEVRAGAEQALRDALEKWAKQHVLGTKWTMADIQRWYLGRDGTWSPKAECKHVDTCNRSS